MEEIVYNCSLKFYKIHFSWAYRIYNSHEEDWAGFLFVQDSSSEGVSSVMIFFLDQLLNPGRGEDGKTQLSRAAIAAVDLSCPQNPFSGGRISGGSPADIRRISGGYPGSGGVLRMDFP